MKTLLILRHAKSSRDDPTLDDHDRPLKKRGLRDALRAGKLLNRKNFVPDLIISSTALRAKLTAEKAAKGCGYKNDIQLRKALYLAGAGGYIRYLQKTPDNYTRVLLVGHNPGLDKLIEQLIGRHERFPTAALAALQLPIEHWENLSANAPYPLILLWRPKQDAST